MLRISIDCAIVLIVVSPQFAFCDNMAPKWTLSVYKQGKLSVTAGIPHDSNLHAEVEKWKASVNTLRRSRTSYSPSIRIESDTFRVDFSKFSTIISKREGRDSVWSQFVRTPTVEDQNMRDILLEYLCVDE